MPEQQVFNSCLKFLMPKNVIMNSDKTHFAFNTIKQPKQDLTQHHHKYIHAKYRSESVEQYLQNICLYKMKTASNKTLVLKSSSLTAVLLIWKKSLREAAKKATAGQRQEQQMLRDSN